MIIIKAPLRISFVGGGTDLADFYRRTPGRVISTTINKYVYVAVNRTPLINKVSARYSISETVSHPNNLQHTRIKSALLDLGILSNIEIASFASLPAKTGFGSSSSFSVALINALHVYLGKKVNKKELAEAACRLEIELIKEPIGKQDQYAATFGGFNIFQFNSDGTVDIEPILLDYKKQALFEDHMLVFFIGITRTASSVLTEQKSKIDINFETYKKMADSVFDFKENLIKGDINKMAEILHRGWFHKKSLASNVSNDLIDNLYGAGLKAGAWGGKILGAGGGGCIMFLAPINKKSAVREAVQKIAKKNQLNEFCEIPVKFVQSGCDIIFNSDTNSID